MHVSNPTLTRTIRSPQQQSQQMLAEADLAASSRT